MTDCRIRRVQIEIGEMNLVRRLRAIETAVQVRAAHLHHEECEASKQEQQSAAFGHPQRVPNIGASRLTITGQWTGQPSVDSQLPVSA